MSKQYEITVYNPDVNKVEKLTVEAVTQIDVERIKSDLVLKGYVTMASRELA